MVTDVVFFGLKKVMPLMTEGLLEYPLLASHYFSLVSGAACFECGAKWSETWRVLRVGSSELRQRRESWEECMAFAGAELDWIKYYAVRASKLPRSLPSLNVSNAGP